MSSRRDMDEQGFDRGRILEWLESVHIHRRPSTETDEWSDFDPDRPPAASQNTPKQQQQQQQQQKQQQQVHRLHHLSSLLQRQRRSGANMTTPSLSISPQHLLTTHRAQSLGSLSLEQATLSNADITFSQPQFRGLHTRQKSDSPLPEIPSEPELPNFDPQTPVLPGNRTQRQTVRSEVTLSRHQPPVLIHARSGQGSVTLSSPGLLPLETSPLRSPSPLTSRYQTGQRGSVPTTVEPEGEMREAEKEVREGKEDLVIEGHPRVNPSLTSSPAHATSHDLTTESLTCDPQPTPLPASSKVEITEAALTPHQTGAVSSTQRTGPVEREGGRGVLTSVELACVSLRVVDILPQLAVYLGVEYGEYESVVSSEPSPQRQSFSVLMKWHRSGSGRETLAHALEQFGDQYSQLAQQLLRGELEESRHTLSEEPLQLQKLSPSPSPTPLSHRHTSPLPQAHPSPDHKSHTIAAAPSPPSSTLSPQSRRMKQGFTFDEERRSSDTLPKFLHSRSLFTISPDSHPLYGSHTPRSQPIQRRLSLSDVSSGSAASWPATPRVGGAWKDSAHPAGHRKSSLPHEELTEIGGRGYQRSRRGSREVYWRKSSLQNEDVLRSLREEYRGVPAVDPNEGRSGSGDPSVGKRGQNPFHYQVIGPLTQRSSLGSAQFARSLPGVVGGRGRKELGVAGGQGSPRGVAKVSGSGRRAIDRRDSGIETLASNFSSLQ